MEMEEPDSYRKRLERSTLYPALSETLSQMTGRVFFNPIDVANVTETVQALFDDVDLAGNNLDVFASPLVLFRLGVWLLVRSDWFYPRRSREKSRRRESLKCPSLLGTY